MQSSSQIVTTNKPTPSVFTGRMPFLSPNQQCQSTEGRLKKTWWDCLRMIWKVSFCPKRMHSLGTNGEGELRENQLTLVHLEKRSLKRCVWVLFRKKRRFSYRRPRVPVEAEDDADSSYVSRSWLHKLETFDDPGPVDNRDFLCRHGGIKLLFNTEYACWSY